LVKKDLLRKSNIVKVCCGDFHTLALTNEGLVLAWGGALSENLSKRKSRLYKDNSKHLIKKEV
jgi:alpha-tubulin suppressor-like RCC1 family protein